MITPFVLVETQDSAPRVARETMHVGEMDALLVAAVSVRLCRLLWAGSPPLEQAPTCLRLR